MPSRIYKISLCRICPSSQASLEQCKLLYPWWSILVPRLIKPSWPSVGKLGNTFRRKFPGSTTLTALKVPLENLKRIKTTRMTWLSSRNYSRRVLRKAHWSRNFNSLQQQKRPQKLKHKLENVIHPKLPSYPQRKSCSNIIRLTLEVLLHHCKERALACQSRKKLPARSREPKHSHSSAKAGFNELVKVLFKAMGIKRLLPGTTMMPKSSIIMLFKNSWKLSFTTCSHNLTSRQLQHATQQKSN